MHPGKRLTVGHCSVKVQAEAEPSLSLTCVKENRELMPCMDGRLVQYYESCLLMTDCLASQVAA